MINALSGLLLTVCLALSTLAAAGDHRQTIREQYLALQALEADDDLPDGETLLRHSYPPLVDAFGGVDAYLALLSAAEDFREEGDTASDDYGDSMEEDLPFKRVSRDEEISVGEVYRQGDELQALVTLRTTEVFAHQEQDGYFRDDSSTGYQLAISRDGGGHWYFLDSTIDWESVVPELHPAISQREDETETRFRDE